MLLLNCRQATEHEGRLALWDAVECMASKWTGKKWMGNNSMAKSLLRAHRSLLLRGRLPAAAGPDLLRVSPLRRAPSLLCCYTYFLGRIAQLAANTLEL